MACDQEYNSERKISELAKKFEDYEKADEENGFAILLQESCRKLMRMLKWNDYYYILM